MAGPAGGSEPAGRRGHMHPLHYWPGTQKFLNPRTAGAPDGLGSFDRLAIRFSHNTPQDISGVFCENRLSSRSKLPNLERPPSRVYCTIQWVHVGGAASLYDTLARALDRVIMNTYPGTKSLKT